MSNLSPSTALQNQNALRYSGDIFNNPLGTLHPDMEPGYRTRIQEQGVFGVTTHSILFIKVR